MGSNRSVDQTCSLYPCQYNPQYNLISWDLYRVDCEVARIPLSIVSNRNPKFPSKFWKAPNLAFGSKLGLGPAYQPHVNSQTERTIQILWTLIGKIYAYTMDLNTS